MLNLQLLSFSVNPLAVFLCRELDERNGFETLVYNLNKNSYIKVSGLGYKVLSSIQEIPNIKYGALLLKFGENKDLLDKFLQEMVSENIIFTKTI